MASQKHRYELDLGISACWNFYSSGEILSVIDPVLKKDGSSIKKDKVFWLTLGPN